MLETGICGDYDSSFNYDRKYIIAEDIQWVTIWGVYSNPWDVLIFALMNNDNWPILVGKPWTHGGVSCGCHANEGQVCWFYVAKGVRELEDATIETLSYQSQRSPEWAANYYCEQWAYTANPSGDDSISTFGTTYTADYAKMSKDLFTTLNLLRTTPNFYYITSNVSTQYYIKDWVNIGYQTAFTWSTTLSLAALDYINAGKDNGQNSASATAKNIYTKALCSSYDVYITHNKNSATNWTVTAPMEVINSYLEQDFFNAYVL